MLRKLSNIVAAFAVVAVCCAFSLPAAADWDPNDPADVARAKWIQLPDLTSDGLDVLDTVQPNTLPAPLLWKTLADDFQCTQTGPIVDAHIWGSWLGDVRPTNSAGVQDPGAIEFKISFWSDVSATDPNNPVPYSHPGNLLWTALFLPGQFTWRTYATAQEGFLDPNTGTIIGSDQVVYQYNFDDLSTAAQPYFQQTQGTIYWFEVQANVLNTLGTAPATFGWKTRETQQHFMDDAVYADTNNFNGPNISFWRPVAYPAGHPQHMHPLDLSFVLTVPEPSAVAIAGIGLVALAGVVLRRSRRPRNS
jgi:hypothetical protein